jgi:hypothetical protein
MTAMSSRCVAATRYAAAVAVAAFLTCLASPVFSQNVALSRDLLEQRIKAGEPLTGVTVAGVNLAGFSAANANLGGLQAEGTDLRGATFTGCYMDGVNLKNAQARGATVVDCSLQDAVLDGADFSGARFEGIDLIGASITGCKFTGAHLADLRFAPSHLDHLPGLRIAMETALGRKVSLAYAAGLTGDAFTFVYCSDTPGYVSLLPFTANPLVSAFDTLGIKATYRGNWIRAAAKNRLEGTLLSKGTGLLPLTLTGFPDVGDIGVGPFWSLVTKLTKVKRDVTFDVTIPGFGSRTLTREQLEQAWVYHTPMLEPAGDVPPEASFALLMVPAPAPKDKKPTPLEIATAALSHVVGLARDERTYMNRWPGVMGMSVLAADLHTASTREDAPAVLRMAAWEGQPRLDLIGARRMAAAFIQEVAPLYDADAQAELISAAGLYASEAQLLAQRWPRIQPDARAKADLDLTRSQCKKASELILEAVVLEKNAAEIIEKALAKK